MKKSNDFAAEVAQQTQAKAPEAPKPKAEKKEEPKKETKPAVAVSAGQVKALRESTGAGMMDCKKALAENGGDEVAAAEVRWVGFGMRYASLSLSTLQNLWKRHLKP